MSVSELGRLSRTVGSSQTCFHAEICLVILNFNLFYIFSPKHGSVYIYIYKRSSCSSNSSYVFIAIMSCYGFKYMNDLLMSAAKN